MPPPSRGYLCQAKTQDFNLNGWWANLAQCGAGARVILNITMER